MKYEIRYWHDVDDSIYQIDLTMDPESISDHVVRDLLATDGPGSTELHVKLMEEAKHDSRTIFTHRFDSDQHG